MDMVQQNNAKMLMEKMLQKMLKLSIWCSIMLKKMKQLLQINGEENVEISEEKMERMVTEMLMEKQKLVLVNKMLFRCCMCTPEFSWSGEENLLV